jgi:hypothetical protein
VDEVRGEPWISVQPEPAQQAQLKGELLRRWSTIDCCTSSKEADCLAGITESSPRWPAVKSSPRDPRRRRLLLVLFALGTNTGIARIAAGAHDETEAAHGTGTPAGRLLDRPRDSTPAWRSRSGCSAVRAAAMDYAAEGVRVDGGFPGIAEAPMEPLVVGRLRDACAYPGVDPAGPPGPPGGRVWPNGRAAPSRSLEKALGVDRARVRLIVSRAGTVTRVARGQPHAAAAALSATRILVIYWTDAPFRVFEALHRR